MKRIIASVESNSIAESYGIKNGDRITAINEIDEFDILDYMMATADDSFTITLASSEETRTIEINNPNMEPIGIHFETMTIDEPKKCHNRCIFCFMDQLPNDMRETLYFKDDDYRLSFTCGNYVTLTNVSDQELERIIDLNLSPMNISVHTTNPDLRIRMMNNPKAGRIMEQLRMLTNGGIELNLQLVLCPGFNDGDELTRTMQDIHSLGSMVKSLSCVPVGITKYREGLKNLLPFDKAKALNVIETIARFRQEAKDIHIESTYCASDEFFLLAEIDFPDDDYYGDYTQYENGVGMARSFIDLFRENASKEKVGLFRKKHKLRAMLITGKPGAEVLQPLTVTLNQQYPHYDIALKPITNTFFGETITASGLVCGSDIIDQCNDSDYDHLIIPSNMLKDDEDIFLDDISLNEVQTKLKKNCHIASFDGTDLFDILHTCKERTHS